MNKNQLALLSMVAFAAAPSLAMAEGSVGIVEDVAGASNIAPYSEISSGTTVALGGEGSIKFVHYSTCREVSVKGGSVTINAQDYKVTGGTATETPQACPQQVHIASNTAVSGGLVMRGKVTVTEVGAHPSIVVSGKRSNVVSSVLFVDDANQAIEVPVKDNRAVFPAGSQALKQDTNYKLQLKGSGKTQLEMPVHVVADASAALLVLHVD